jgi:hypothetical protein
VALQYRPRPQDTLEAFLIGSTDDLSLRSQDPDPAVSVALDTHQYFSRLLWRWTHRFASGGSLVVLPYLGGATSRATTGDHGFGGVPLSSQSSSVDYGLRVELERCITQYLHLTAGLDLVGYRSDFAVLTTQQLATQLTAGSSDRASAATATPLAAAVEERTVLNEINVAPYAIARFEFWSRRLIISPQLRLATTYQHAYDGAIETRFVFWEPRLFISYQLIPRWLRLKLGIGAFSQLPVERESSQSYGNPRIQPEHGTTYVAGVESELTATLSAVGQFFYRDLRTLIVPDASTIYSNSGIGHAIGADFLLRQRLWRGLFGWLAYTVSRSERKDGPSEPWRPSVYDQTHILTVILSYKLPWQRWGLEVGVRLRYVTGNPTTPIIGGIRDANAQSWSALEGLAYLTRLPDFHQLDLRIDKTMTFNRWKLGLYLDVQNLYNRANTEQLVYGGRQLFQSAPVSGLPLFPNLGARAEF